MNYKESFKQLELMSEMENAMNEFYETVPESEFPKPESPNIVIREFTAKEKQVGGNHYKLFAIQPYEFCYKNGLNNLQSEAVSYIVRYDKKWPGDIEKQLIDLKKAKHTIELLIEQIENEQRSS